MEEQASDSTVSLRGSGSDSLMMGIPTKIATRMKFKKGDKLLVWTVTDEDGEVYMVVQTRPAPVPPKILSKLRNH